MQRSVSLCAKYLKQLRTDFDIFKEECLYDRNKSISFGRGSGFFHGSPDHFPGFLTISRWVSSDILQYNLGQLIEDEIQFVFLQRMLVMWQGITSVILEKIGNSLSLTDLCSLWSGLQLNMTSGFQFADYFATVCLHLQSSLNSILHSRCSSILQAGSCAVRSFAGCAIGQHKA